ncbi:nuclear transport factor 2 family protein [Kitasatospora sp. NPDC005856]|uniref:nuclear transport factor 2 family protein n=1 Tax=Kitasatospora sp. NPDC005856 TaxID=3154566 RepID=UPI0033DCA429
MNDFQAVADRVEITALQAEFTDAVMMRDRARLAALFTPDGVLRMPDVPIELTGPEQIRVGGEKLQEQWDFFIQNTHPGTITVDGDTATGRAHVHEIARLKNGFQGLNYAVYHDRYRRTADGWRFTERVYETRYLDTSPLTGSAPNASPVPNASGPVPHTASFTDPAPAGRLERTAAALAANGFTVEVLDDAAAARAQVGGAALAIWVVGAQKVVPDLPAALRRLERHVLPLESERALAAYGRPSAVNQLLVLNAPARLARGTVLLLREAIGF